MEVDDELLELVKQRKEFLAKNKEVNLKGVHDNEAAPAASHVFESACRVLCRCLCSCFFGQPTR